MVTTTYNAALSSLLVSFFENTFEMFLPVALIRINRLLCFKMVLPEILTKN